MNARIPLRLQSIALFAAILFALATPVSASAPNRHHGSVSLANAVQGTWEQVWPQLADHERAVKLINATHFSWTHWDTGTHHVIATAGGPYTLVGQDYCEQLLFAQGGVESASGRVLSFRVQVKGDSLIQLAPAASDGARSREIWRRLR